MNISKFTYWENLLIKQGYKCQFLPKDETVGYPRLMIDLGKDHRERSRLLEMRFNHYPLPISIEAGSVEGEKTEKMPEDQVVNHLFVALPFFVKPETFGEVSRFLMLLNKNLDIPGFGLDEETKLVFFRYGIFTYKGHQSTRLLFAMIGMITLLIDAQTPQIEAISQGATIQEVLSSLVHSLLPTE